MAAATAPDLSALDIEALRAMVVEQHAVIERLQTMIAHLRRMQFGRKSEKIDRQVEQLELELEDLESAKAARLEELERKLKPANAAAARRLCPKILDGRARGQTHRDHVSRRLAHCLHDETKDA